VWFSWESNRAMLCVGLCNLVSSAIHQLTTLHKEQGSRDNADDVATGCGLHGRGVEVRVLAGARFVLHVV
jgi:hypothetical protein